MKKLDKILEFLNTLDIDIDFNCIDLDNIETFEDLTDALNDSNMFDVEIIYYSRAIEYLKNHDPSLADSISIAAELGFDTSSINSELLASLHASEELRTEWHNLEDEITDFFDDLNDDEI
jgi:hypothetical protein